MKKKLSRLLCALLVMTMVLAMVPAVSAAEYDSLTNTDQTAQTKTKGSTFTVKAPCSTKGHESDLKVVVLDADSGTELKDYLVAEDATKPLSLTVKKVADSDSGEKELKVITYCTNASCKNNTKKYTTPVTVKYASIGSFAVDTAKSELKITSGKAQLPKGDSIRVRIKIADSTRNGSEENVNQNVRWRSSNMGAITVAPDKDDSRWVTLTASSSAKAGAASTIRAVAEGDNTKYVEFTVTVTDNDLTLKLDKEELSLDIGKTTSVGYTIGGPSSSSSSYVTWWLTSRTLTTAERKSTIQELYSKLPSTDVAELTGESDKNGNGYFKTLKNGTFYLLAQASTVKYDKFSDIQVCRVHVKDGSYDVEIIPTKAAALKNDSSLYAQNAGALAGVYDPEDEDDKFFTAEEYTDKDRLTLTAWLKSDSASSEATIPGTWSVADSDVVAFENYDKDIRTKTVSSIKDAEKVTIRAIGRGRTTVTVKTDEGDAKYVVEVWDKTMILAPSTTAYDYTSEVTVSSDNPLASMQSKRPTHPVTEYTTSGTRVISVPVEWMSQRIDSKNETVTFTGELKLQKNENYSVYQVVKSNGQPYEKNETYNVGKTISALKVVATGSSNLSYQWYDATETNKAISGATKATYTPEITKSGTYKYYCIVSAGGEYVVSETATIKVSGEYRVVLSNSSDKTVSTPSANVGSATTYGVDVEKWDYSTGKYGSAGSCTISWAVTKNSEYGTVSSTSSSVTFTGKLAKAATKGFETMTVTATIKKSGTEVGTEEILVTVNPAEAATVKQSVGSGAAIKSSSIIRAVTKAAGSSAKVSYIVFGSERSCKLTKSSSSSSSIDDTKCYVSTTSGQKLSDVYVKTSASSASVTYTAYDADDYVLATGTVSFDTNDTNDTISSSGASFKNAAAIDQIIENYPDADYVKFDLPSAADGKLYYEFRTISDYTGEVKDSDKYYLNAGSKDLDAEDVYFLPAYGVKGKVTISYTAYSSSNSDLGSGKISLTVRSKTASSKFTDVTAKNVGSWAADSIDFCADNDLVNGKSTYSFAPSDNLTRGQLVAILYRAAGTPSVSGISNPFTDVKSSAYYYNAVLWAYKNGVVTGTSADKFSPDANVTREQIAAILYRYMGSPAATGSLTGYADRAKISAWATTAMQWAIGKGYITGIGTNLDPAGKATRAQVAVMMHRFLTK